MKASVSLRSPLPYLNNRSFRNLWSIQTVAVALLVTTTTSWLAYGEENYVWKRRRPRCLHYLLSEAAACWGIQPSGDGHQETVDSGSAEKISGRHHSSDDDTGHQLSQQWSEEKGATKHPANVNVATSQFNPQLELLFMHNIDCYILIFFYNNKSNKQKLHINLFFLTMVPLRIFLWPTL